MRALRNTESKRHPSTLFRGQIDPVLAIGTQRCFRIEGSTRTRFLMPIWQSRAGMVYRIANLFW
jgi:hypothetical protein